MWNFVLMKKEVEFPGSQAVPCFQWLVGGRFYLILTEAQMNMKRPRAMNV